MRKWMKLHDSMCGSVCVREREGSGHRTKASLWVIGTTFFTLPSLSLSLSHIHSLFQSPYHSETLKLLRKILRYGHSYSECAQFQFRFSLSTPSVYTHTHTHLTFYVSVWANFLSQSQHFLHVSSHHMRSSSTLRIPLRSGAALSPLSPTLGTS